MSDKKRDPEPVSERQAPEEPRRSPEAWAQDKATAAHVLAGARHHNRWVAGDQITATEFEKGLAAFLEEPIR